jgi:hypothetical protein
MSTHVVKPWRASAPERIIAAGAIVLGQYRRQDLDVIQQRRLS